MSHQIFIVDDSKVQLVMLEKVLQNEGFRVHSFTDGFSLLKGLERLSPSLIISDIDMPGMNGFELFDEVRQRYGQLPIPFFFMSSNANIVSREQLSESGADFFLQKPFKIPVLIDVIMDLLDGSRAGVRHWMDTGR